MLPRSLQTQYIRRMRYEKLTTISVISITPEYIRIQFKSIEINDPQYISHMFNGSIDGKFRVNIPFWSIQIKRTHTPRDCLFRMAFFYGQMLRANQR